MRERSRGDGRRVTKEWNLGDEKLLSVYVN